MSRPNSQTKAVTIRLPHDVLERLRAIAWERHIGYQTLINEICRQAIEVQVPTQR